MPYRAAGPHELLGMLSSTVIEETLLGVYHWMDSPECLRSAHAVKGIWVPLHDCEPSGADEDAARHAAASVRLPRGLRRRASH